MKNYHILVIVFFIITNCIIIPQHSQSVLEGTHKNAYTKIYPPSIFADRVVLGKTATSNFDIYYESPAPPVEAKNAIEYAVNIWEFLINTAISQTINVQVKWEDLGYSSTAGYPLANCGPASFYNSSSLPQEDVQYPISLAEYLLNQNLNGTDYEIIMTINSNNNIEWYFGTDGIPQEDKPDMVSVVLHEIAHGLGYVPSFNVNGNLGTKGFGGFPVNTDPLCTIYDQFGVIGSYYPNLDLLVNYPNQSTELKTNVMLQKEMEFPKFV